MIRAAGVLERIDLDGGAPIMLASEDLLISEAIARFRQRAEMVSAEIGHPGYRLVEMNVNTTGHSPGPLQVRAMAMEAQTSAPTFEAGSQPVEVKIHGTIELKP